MNSHLLRCLGCLVAWMFFFQLGMAQDCGSDLLHKQLLQNSEEYRQSYFKQNKTIAIATEKLQSDRAANKLEEETLTIPVVVHILHHPSSALGEGSNIEESQVHQALAHLNEAFQNTGEYQSNNGVNTSIEFCLATKDESNAATTGINRFPTVEYSEIDMVAEEPDFKSQTIRWNSHKYLNIWVVEEICSPNIPDNPCAVVGYAYTAQVHGSERDGVVIEAGKFGTFVNASKVLVHEVGHYLNLQHTFHNGCENDNCWMDGDFVCDTPPDNSSSAQECHKHSNTCTTDSDDTNVRNPFRPVHIGGLGDQKDLSNNYMDYNYYNCMDSFTEGQKDRMRLSLTTTRKSLLESAKCDGTPPDDPVLTADAGISEIVAPNGFSCESSVNLKVELTNHSEQPLTSVNIHHQLNEGLIQVYAWQGNLAAYQSTVVTLPKTIFITENIQTIRVYTTNPNGISDENANNNLSQAEFYTLGSAIQLPFFEDFESLNSETPWSIVNPDGLQSWQPQYTTNCHPNEHRSLVLNGHSYSAALEESDLLQLYLDMENLEAAELRFDVAYAPYSVSFAETLRIFASKDCGENHAKIYEKSGLELATSNVYQTEDWSPKSCNDWRTEILDLTQFAGGQTQLYFEVVNRNGNNLFLDNIFIHDKSETTCDAPSNLSIEVTMADRASLNWSGKSDNIAYNVWFKPVDTEDWSVVTIEAEEEKVVTGLKPSTIYEMQLQSICSDGSASHFSNRQFFQTLDLPACHSPLQQRVESVGGTTALLRWEQAGLSESYTVRYRPQGSNSWSLAFGKIDSAEIRNLQPETTYEAAVRSKCANGISGNSDYGALLTFKTTPECPAPSSIQVINTSTNEADIAYTTAPEADFVNFKYRAKNVTQWTDAGTTAAKEHNINDLKAGTIYEVQAAGICDNQLGDFSRSAVFSTNALCDAPKNFSYTYNPSNNLVIISWDAPEGAALYEVEYKQILPTEASEWQSVVVSSTKAYLGNLQVGGLYHYKVRSQCSDNAPSDQNNSYYSNIQSFTTKNDCEIPTNLTTNSIGNEYAQLSWDSNGSSNTFGVRYRIAASNMWEYLTASQNQIEIFNLQPDTDYEFEVRMQCGSVPTGFSEAFAFKTKNDVCATSPTGLEAVEIKNRSATLYWLDTAGSSSYKFAYRVSNQSQWTEIEVDNRYVILENLQPCFIYEYRVASICENGQSSFSPSDFFATECVSYCNVSSTSSEQNWIESFDIEGQKFTSSSNSTYTYFEAEEINLAKGKSYVANFNIDIEGKISNQYLSVWMDFNQDYVFQASENVWREEIGVESFLNEEIVRTSATLDIPDETPLGTMRMRVILSASESTEPCENFDLGEVEDYLVKIISLRGDTDNLELLSLQLSPNPANESVWLQFGKKAESTNWRLKVVDIAGRTVLKQTLRGQFKNGKHKLNTSHLQKGVYFVILENEKDRTIQKLFVGD